MYVYLIQHGAAKSREEDPERGLTDEGTENVVRVSGFLSLFAKPAPVAIVHSGKTRARQTADIFAQRLGVDEVRADPDLEAKADPGVWSAHLAGARDDLMLVGHLPHLERLAGLLLANDGEATPVRFSNGGVFCLERGEAGAWSLRWGVVPQLLG